MDDNQTAAKIREAFGVIAGILIDLAESDAEANVDLEDAFMAQSMLVATIQAETAFRLGEDDHGALSFLDDDEFDEFCECDDCRKARVN